MKDKLIRFFQRIKNDVGLLKLGETETKSGIIEPILRMLEWDTSIMSGEVKLEYPVEGGRIDYCLQTNLSNKVFLEAKKPSEDLDRHKDQLLNYAFREGIDLAILSNGITWSFFLPLDKGPWEERQFYTVDINEQDSTEAATSLIEFLSREKIASGNAIEKARRVLADRKRDEIIVDTIPDAWNRIIKELDETLINLLAEKTNKICGHLPTRNDIEKFFYRIADRILLTPEDEEEDEYTEQQPVETLRRYEADRERVQVDEDKKISQEQLANDIIFTLQSLGGRADKSKVLELIHKKYEYIFKQPYYLQLVSHGVPRWRHNIAWAKEAVKHRGFLKYPSESGRGMWELTAEGKNLKIKS